MKLFSKQFIHDKLALLLLSMHVFLVFIWTVVVALRLAGNKGASGYFIEYRPVVGGIAQYKQGGIFDVLGFLIFLWVVLIIVGLIAARSYDMKRQLSLMVLGFGILITLFTMVVSNALLVLH